MCKITAKMYILHINFPHDLVASLPAFSSVALYEDSLIWGQLYTMWLSVACGEECMSKLPGEHFWIPSTITTSVSPHLLKEVLSAGEGPKHKYPLDIKLGHLSGSQTSLSSYNQPDGTVSKLNIRALPPILNYVPWLRVGTSVRSTNDLKAISYNHISPLCSKTFTRDTNNKIIHLSFTIFSSSFLLLVEILIDREIAKGQKAAEGKTKGLKNPPRTSTGPLIINQLIAIQLSFQ